MGTQLWRAALAALILASGFQEAARTQTLPQPASTAGQHLTIIGVIKNVGIGTDRLLFAGGDGRTYTLDISHAKVTVPSGARPQLTPGMRAYVSGQGRLGGTIIVSRFQVLPVALPRLAAASVIPETADPLDFTVRGTVEGIDFEHGAFILRINTHTRIIYVTADTDISGLSAVAAGRFPVQPGQRVTVGGSLQPDGTVLAGLLAVKGDVDYRTAPDQPNRVLMGAISSPPNKFRSRDMKIRTEDGTETKIIVPRGIPIRRSGRSISVYDLTSRDEIRVTGRVIETDFHAARIDVLAPLPVPAPASEASPPSRPGL
ncbi:MAG: hypothetical protein ACRYFS_14825 [Janthinobacterium lividum]